MNKKKDHVISTTNVRLSPFMKRFYVELSEKHGGNANNQSTLSHGIQVMALLNHGKKGIDTNKLYPNINH